MVAEKLKIACKVFSLALKVWHSLLRTGRQRLAVAIANLVNSKIQAVLHSTVASIMCPIMIIAI